MEFDMEIDYKLRAADVLYTLFKWRITKLTTMQILRLYPINLKYMYKIC